MVPDHGTILKDWNDLNMKSKRTIFSTLLILCIFLATGGFLLTARIRFTEYRPGDCPESAAELSNPWNGWYRIYRYDLSDSNPEPFLEISRLAPGPGLALLEFNLQNYADGPVSEDGLSRLDALLQAWDDAGKQLIVRFLYDWDGHALDREPESLDQILTHMSQTAEVLNAHTDCVYILQGAFIGSWGEMHGSRHASEENLITLMNHLDTVVSPDIYLAVRTPEQWRSVTGTDGPGGEETSLSRRLGVFNDGMLGSVTDLNTYGEPDAGPGGKRPREEELSFLNCLGREIPHGGEVVLDNPYNDLENAVRDLAEAHVSYLNGSYDEAVLNKWKRSVYHGDGPFHGMSGYDYISRHLGYRYVLTSSSFNRPNPRSGSSILSVTLVNTGFSRSYVPFDVNLCLEHTGTGQTISLPVPADTCSWTPGTEVTFDIPFDVCDSSLGTGSYRVCLQILDPASGHEVRLANDAPCGAHGCTIGYLEIRSLPEFSKQNLFSRAPVSELDGPSV